MTAPTALPSAKTPTPIPSSNRTAPTAPTSYKVLTQEVIPLFFQRDAQGIPRQWIQRIRRAMVTLVPQFTTDRMVREYAEKYYLAK